MIDILPFPLTCENIGDILVILKVWILTVIEFDINVELFEEIEIDRSKSACGRRRLKLIDVLFRSVNLGVVTKVLFDMDRVRSLLSMFMLLAKFIMIVWF